MNAPLIFAASDVLAEKQRWLAQLAHERRLSVKTVEAYERDLRQFLTFLTTHVGGPAKLGDLANLKPLDMRAFLAERRREGACPFAAAVLPTFFVLSGWLRRSAAASTTRAW